MLIFPSLVHVGVGLLVRYGNTHFSQMPLQNGVQKKNNKDVLHQLRHREKDLQMRT